jgi:predicted ATPase
MERSFRSFLRAICLPSKPVLLCLRGLQWADEQSLQLLQYLVRDSECHGLIIVVCYRDDDEGPYHLEEALHRMERRKNVTKIHLENSKRTDLHQLVADVTRTSANLSKTEELSQDHLSENRR